MSSVTDYNIANASGASVRSDLNNVLLAVATNNSDTAEPATTYAFMLWIDTTNNLVKMRNGANDAWLTMPFAMNASNSVDINAGTIDGTSIGSSSTSTGAFTTLSASTSLDVTGIIVSDGMSTNTSGTSNFIAGVNAGNSIASGGNYNLV